MKSLLRRVARIELEAALRPPARSPLDLDFDKARTLQQPLSEGAERYLVRCFERGEPLSSAARLFMKVEAVMYFADRLEPGSMKSPAEKIGLRVGDLRGDNPGAHLDALLEAAWKRVDPAVPASLYEMRFGGPVHDWTDEQRAHRFELREALAGLYRPIEAAA